MPEDVKSWREEEAGRIVGLIREVEGRDEAGFFEMDVI